MHLLDQPLLIVRCVTGDQDEALEAGRVVQLESEDEIGRLDALFRRLLFPTRDRDEPPGDAPGSAAGDGR